VENEEWKLKEENYIRTYDIWGLDKVRRDESLFLGRKCLRVLFHLGDESFWGRLVG